MRHVRPTLSFDIHQAWTQQAIDSLSASLDLERRALALRFGLVLSALGALVAIACDYKFGMELGLPGVSAWVLCAIGVGIYARALFRRDDARIEWVGMLKPAAVLELARIEHALDKSPLCKAYLQQVAAQQRPLLRGELRKLEKCVAADLEAWQAQAVRHALSQHGIALYESDSPSAA